MRSWISGVPLPQVLCAVFLHLWPYLVIWCLSCSRKCVKIASKQSISKFQCLQTAGELLSRFDSSVWWGLQIFRFFSWELSFWMHKCGKNTFCCSHQSNLWALGGSGEFPLVLAGEGCIPNGRKNKLLYCCGQAEVENLLFYIKTDYFSPQQSQSWTVQQTLKSSYFKFYVLTWEVFCLCTQMQLFEVFWSKYPCGTHGYVHWDLYFSLPRLASVEGGLNLGDVGKVISSFLVHWFFI